MQAIETRYNGCKFRSRLEARWAVFMDGLGVEFRYEHEGYDLDGIWYLPDFWLPQQVAWLEIKPVPPTEAELNKIDLLARATGRSAALFHDLPGKYPGDYMAAARLKEGGPVSTYHSPPMRWFDCPACGIVRFIVEPFDGDHWCPCGRRGPVIDSPRYQSAITTAREFRF